MSEYNNTGGNSMLGFIVGGLVVIVALLAFFVYGDGFGGTKQVDLNVTTPSVTTPNVTTPKTN